MQILFPNDVQTVLHPLRYNVELSYVYVYILRAAFLWTVETICKNIKPNPYTHETIELKKEHRNVLL